MSFSQEIANPREPITTNKKLVPLLEIFVDMKYGEEVWNHMLTINKFCDLITHHYPKYGDLVFHDIVDLIVKYNGIEIKIFIKEFADFINNYY